MSSRILEAHGGSVRVNGAAGRGDGVHREHSGMAQWSGRMSSRILLVEDEPSVALTVSDLLAGKGYDVETAVDERGPGARIE